jgi:hypothetical protein
MNTIEKPNLCVMGWFLDVSFGQAWLSTAVVGLLGVYAAFQGQIEGLCAPTPRAMRM